MAYIDEGECSAFVNSQIGFTVDGKKASETMIWRKGGAPTNPIGLTLTINGNTPGNLNSDSDSIGNTKDKKIVPELPGPALRVTPEIAKIEKKENTVVVKESKKSEDMIIVVPSENKDTLSIDSDKNNLNEKSTSNNPSSQQKIEDTDVTPTQWDETPIPQREQLEDAISDAPEQYDSMGDVWQCPDCGFKSPYEDEYKDHENSHVKTFTEDDISRPYDNLLDNFRS